MNKQFKDGLERIVRTVVQAAAAAWLVEEKVSLDGLKVAGVAGVVALAMALAGTRVGSKNDTSLLPVADGEAGMTAVELCIVVIALIVVLWAFGVLPR